MAGVDHIGIGSDYNGVPGLGWFITSLIVIEVIVEDTYIFIPEYLLAWRMSQNSPTYLPSSWDKAGQRASWKRWLAGICSVS